MLSDVTFSVAPGECLGLVGGSGAGKTTLLRTIATILQPRAGRIIFDGINPALLKGRALRHVRTRIGMIAQHHDLVDALRVDRNVMAGALGRWSRARALRYFLRPNAEELDEARRALAAVGLESKLVSRTSSLSGGERQRVALARTLIQAPALLLADEPVASLDPERAQEILALIALRARDRGMAVIMSLHQPELAERFCDRVLEVAHGTLAERRGGGPALTLATR